MNDAQHAEKVRWWHRLKPCPEHAPDSGYRCQQGSGHKGPHGISICIDAQDDRWIDEDWPARNDGRDDAHDR